MPGQLIHSNSDTSASACKKDNELSMAAISNSSSAANGADATLTTNNCSTSTTGEEPSLVETLPGTNAVNNNNSNTSADVTAKIMESENDDNLPSNSATAAATISTPPKTTSIDKQTNIDTIHKSILSARSRSMKSNTPVSPRPCIVSRTSSLGFKSISSNSSSKQHAYFASSEEESEAELDEKDSHSSRASNTKYVTKTMSSPQTSLRGSKKLTEIASMSHHSQQQEELHAALFHKSRIGLLSSVEQQRMCSNEDCAAKIIAPIIYKSLPSHGTLPVPPPLQTVTVALGKDSISVDHTTTIAPSASGGGVILHAKSHSNPSAPPNLLSHPYSVASLSPIRKRKLNNKDRCHRHKHLPRGLPVFNDPRSCMWTSTHDANDPSEDRYSSLVNVLLRPPKTPRSSNSGSGSGRKSEVVAFDGSEMESKDNPSNANHAAVMAGEVGAKAHLGSHVGETNKRQAQEQGGKVAGGDDKNSHRYNNANDSNAADDDDDDDDDENTSLIRLSLWSVIDGHGGGCVATYAAEVLLPHIAASVARALKSKIVDRGICNVNGQLRDANALDLDGLIRSSDRSKRVGKVRVRQREAGIDAVNPNSIHYRSPFEDSESVSEHDHFDCDEEDEMRNDHHPSHVDAGMRSESESEAPGNSNKWTHGESVSSVKTSLKTAVSPNTHHAPTGTHSPSEVAAITRAITDSFLAIDEGWINSIDPVTTHQTSCVSNGRWNAGACALIVFIVQRLDWCRFSRVDHEIHHRELGVDGFDDTSHNRDAARRRKLDYAGKSKSVSSLSTISSTSSITTEENITENILVEESEITETEDDDDVSDIFGQRRLSRKKGMGHHLHHGVDDPHHQEGAFVATPAGCKCHYYRPLDAMMYTAHVGDCRAVMLGSAPPRTIKVPPEGDSNLSLDHTDTSEDESSSESVADEISSSEHDSDSSGDEDDNFMRHGAAGAGNLGKYALRNVRKRRHREEKTVIDQPFIPLPPLNRRDASSEESAVESDDSTSTTAQDDVLQAGTKVRGVGGGVVTIFNDLSEEEKFLETEDEDEIKEIRSVRSGSPTQMDCLPSPSPTQLVADPVHPPPLPLSMQMRPIDLTTDHSAYNPAEVTAVLRRCNNAPKAISAASSGGIKRVAGSLAVTRALGDAYLKTPRLSFFPYKRHAPYITARPEVNCRILTKGADRILTLASDGVWERASGEDVLRWVRNYYNSLIAGVKEHHLQSSMYDVEDEDHDVLFGESSRRNSLLTEKALLSTGISSNAVAAFGMGCTSRGAESSSEVNGVSVQEKSATLASLSRIDDSGKTAGVNESESLPNGDGNLDNSPSEPTTSANISSKRKHPDSDAFDDSVSSRSCSTASSQSHGVGTAIPTMHHHHYYFSSRSPHSLPNVADVIVHKVLNKVRKTRNISSLRMLMSLPKGRARRSKHDDITATVVDLDFFI